MSFDIVLPSCALASQLSQGSVAQFEDSHVLLAMGRHVDVGLIMPVAHDILIRLALLAVLVAARVDGAYPDAAGAYLLVALSAFKEGALIAGHDVFVNVTCDQGALFSDFSAAVNCGQLEKGFERAAWLVADGAIRPTFRA